MLYAIRFIKHKFELHATNIEVFPSCEFVFMTKNIIHSVPYYVSGLIELQKLSFMTNTQKKCAQDKMHKSNNYAINKFIRSK